MPLKSKAANASRETFYAYLPEDDHGMPPKAEPSRESAIGFDLVMKEGRLTKKVKRRANKVKPIEATFDGTMFKCTVISFYSNKQWMPKNALVPPPEYMCDNEELCHLHQFCSREECLHRVAKFNREIYASVSKPGLLIRSWAIAIEFGHFKHKMLRSIQLEGRLGVANTYHEQPIRVIRPTADEIARLGSLTRAKKPR